MAGVVATVTVAAIVAMMVLHVETVVRVRKETDHREIEVHAHRVEIGAHVHHAHRETVHRASVSHVLNRLL
jgi:hypothetical protein